MPAQGIFEYEIESGDSGKPGAVILGTLQERRHLEIPERIGDLPVWKIAPHALSGKTRLQTVAFPRTLRSVGAFALHNCTGLEEVSLYDGIEDYHNGVLRQDVRLRRIRLHVERGNYTVMRDILADGDRRLQFQLDLPDGEARLLFPGYDYAFSENTMARTIQFTISGSGMVYRECVRRKGIGFREYDRLFARVIPDDPHAAVEIAADRLLCPYDLAPVHEEAYLGYLRAHAGEALLQFVEELKKEPEGTAAEGVRERIRLMADRGLISREAADGALRTASEAGLAEVCTIILQGRNRMEEDPSGEKEAGSAGMLSLDDWDDW